MTAKQTPGRVTRGQRSNASAGSDSGSSVRPPADIAATLRCFGWRNAGNACGCAYVSDCQLARPLPVHDGGCCPGIFEADGRLAQHCGTGAR